MRKLLRRVGDGGYWAPETVIAAGRLLYAPPIVTGRETDEAVAAAQNSAALDQWIAGFAQREAHSVAEVRAALFGQLLAAHDREMNNAISPFAHEDMVRAIEAVMCAFRKVLHGVRPPRFGAGSTPRSFKIARTVLRPTWKPMFFRAHWILA